MNCAAKVKNVSRVLSFCCLVSLVFGQAALADTINLGFISFDGFIPGGSASPGVNEFSINNFTGDPALGGLALPPDFPAFTLLTFQNARLTLNETSGPEVFDLGDISAGTALSDLITASTDILSATFTATLDQTVLSLADSSTFTAGSAKVEAFLSPSSPPLLGAGDFALITVSSPEATVPEPASLWLLLAMAVPLACRRLSKQP